MASTNLARKPKYNWVDHPNIQLAPSPTNLSTIAAAVIKSGRSWADKTSLKVYVRKTTRIARTKSRKDTVTSISREFETWSSLDTHPYILACKDFSYEAHPEYLDQATFWSEYCEWGDLAPYIAREGVARKKTLSATQKSQIICQVTSALVFIHYGLYIMLDRNGRLEKIELRDHEAIAHRDIKPQNIFIYYLDPSNLSSGPIHVKLGDFGCAKPLCHDSTMSNSGTEDYRAPEVKQWIRDGKHPKPEDLLKADMWSLGVTMRDITHGCGTIYDSCCKLDPVHRPTSVQLFEQIQGQTKNSFPQPFAYEAISKFDSTMSWDILLIERILEAGADPNGIGPDGLRAVEKAVLQPASRSEKLQVIDILSEHRTTQWPSSTGNRLMLGSSTQRRGLDALNKNMCEPTMPSSQTDAYDYKTDQPGIRNHAATAAAAYAKYQLSQLQREKYTVGWICANPVEMAAAQEMIDEAHDNLEYNGNQEFLYSLGTIAGHNVVIVCPSAGGSGNFSMAIMATQLKAVFEGVRFALMVGIGGGVPSAGADIRLGDVVVSMPCGTFGGVVQYDVGRVTPSGFERTGSLNSPPSILLDAVMRVRADELRGKSKVSMYVHKIGHIPSFQRESAGPDLLFKASYDHERGGTCGCCRTDMQEVRQPRDGKQEVVIHYGTIASGSRLIEDAMTRDEMSLKLGGILCFETKAAGVMNILPSLVIRGVCDYADSHKNYRWQPYAAATAAAYAKEVLSTMLPIGISSH